MSGYHQRQIVKGVLGGWTKIREEYEEFQDACEQGNPVLQLCELADLVGAIERFLEARHPSVSLDDLRTMARATRRSFEAGERVESTPTGPRPCCEIAMDGTPLDPAPRVLPDVQRARFVNYWSLGDKSRRSTEPL